MNLMAGTTTVLGETFQKRSFGAMTELASVSFLLIARGVVVSIVRVFRESKKCSAILCCAALCLFETYTAPQWSERE